MGSEPIIVVISDEEDDGGFCIKPSGPSWPVKPHKRNMVVDGDNDVVLIEKMPCLEGRTTEKGTAALTSLAEKKSPCDDDCYILNYDPDNTVHVPDYQANEADDLVVVGERGPVACRDYPHARHLCVKFPFKTTSHERHCEQCHCYVCDVLAPCLLWGQGKQTRDHCHAFDKDEKWKLMRNHARPPPPKLVVPLPEVTRYLRAQNIQPQSRTHIQPMFGVTTTLTGISSSMNHIYSNANLSSHDQWTTNLNVPPAHPRPYVPSSIGATGENGAYGNRFSLPASMPPVVDLSPGSNVVPAPADRMRFYSQHNSIAMATLTSCAREQDVARQVSHRPPPNCIAVHEALRTSQACTSRGIAIHKNTHIRVPQVETSIENEAHSPQMRHSQEHGAEMPMMAPRSLVEGSGGVRQRVLTQPLPSPLSSFSNDLLTLRSYLFNGISGPSQDQPMVHGSSARENGHVLMAVLNPGDTVSGRPSQESWKRQLEGLNDSIAPSQIPEFNNVETGAVAPKRAVTGEAVQTVVNMPGADSGNQETPEHTLCTGSKVYAPSSLDDLLAHIDDDDLWTLFESDF